MTFQPAQIADATTIMKVASARGLNQDWQVLGVMTALTETSLDRTNYVHGDTSVSSSLGPFQQISTWGTVAQREDVATAAGLFYDRAQQVGNNLTVASTPWIVAQAVQQSKFANGGNYYADLGEAKALVAQINAGNAYTGGAGSSPTTGVVSKADAVPGTPYVINGVTLDDPVWKNYFDTQGNLSGIGSTRDNGYGKKVVVATQVKLTNGTYINLIASDDISHYSAAQHLGADRKNISSITMVNQKLTGYIRNGVLVGAVSDGGGAVELPLLGIPDAISTGLSSVLGAAKPYLWIASGGVLVLLGVLLIAKSSTPKVTL